MRKPTLLIAAAGVSLLSGTLQAENAISWQGYQYDEGDNRIDVRGGAVTIEQDFGTDYALTAGIDYDTVTGATPMWVPISGYTDQYRKGKVELEPESRDGSFASLLMRDSRRNEYTLGLSYSVEPDYIARSVSAQTRLWQDSSHNRSWIIGLQRMANTARASDYTNHHTDEDLTKDYLQAGLSQVINANTTLEASLYYGRDDGYMSNQYLQIVRMDEFGNRALAPDSRPESRESGGFSVRGIHSLQPGLVVQLWYRYYQDDWAIDAHTVEAKLYWNLTPRLRLNPVARYGQQTEAEFYRDYSDAVNYFSTTGYGSNDERLGAFDTHTLQMNLEFLASKEWSLNTGISRYTQDNGFDANWVSAGFVFRH